MLDILTENFDAFASGLWVTTRLVLASFFVALVVGTVVAALRVSPSPGRRTVGAVYVESFRNTPLLVLLFISCAGLRRAEVDISAWDRRYREPRRLHVGLCRGGAALLRNSGQPGQIEAGLSLGF